MTSQVPAVSTARSSARALEIAGLSMSFGGRAVLRRVSLDINAGEIVGLVGANGAGKSTLVKILAGVHKPTEAGIMRVWGSDYSHGISDAESAGLGIVHQELPLVTSLSVAENLAIGSHFDRHGARPIIWRRERARSRKLLSEFGLTIDPNQTVARLSHAQRTQVAILRTLGSMREADNDRWMVLLDEPTAALPAADASALMDWIRMLRGGGSAVLLISHKLSEVIRTCDRIVVLRDGEVTWSGLSSGTTVGALAAEMTGQHLNEQVSTPVRRERNGDTPGPPVLCLQQVSTAALDNVSFEVRPGEIVGLTGLADMGQDEIPYAVIGERPLTAGTISMHGKSVRLTPAAAVRAGVAFVAGDRSGEAMWGDGRAVENGTITSLRNYVDRAVLRRGRELRNWERAMINRKVSPPRPQQTMNTFSGGNQQKIVVARGLASRPALLMLQEPVQGMDVSARELMVNILHGEAAAGLAIVLISTDYELLADACHRVLIFAHGTLTEEMHELSAATVERECIVRAA